MKFNKILTLLTIPFWFIACKSSSKSTANNEQLDNALLWEISGKGISEPSYLYGTIHMIPSEDYFLPDGTLSAIDKSKKMMFEIDMAEMSDMGALMGMMGKIFMSDGLTLKDLLSEADYNLVNEKFSKMGLPMFMLERIKPMFLSAMTYGDMDPGALQSGKIKSYEMEFYEMAQDKQLPTGGLETIDFQISVFDSIPYKDQAQMLVQSMKTSSTDDDEFKIMIDMYKNQDIQSMVTMIGDDKEGLAEYEDILLKKRNETWINQIIENAKSQTTFIAVGAGHLAGKNGVINLLRKKGIIMSPLSVKK